MKNRWLWVFIALEILILIWSFYTKTTLPEAMRIAARYSARLSAVVYLLSFYKYTLNDVEQLKKWLFYFLVVHFIHFGFLSANVYLNKIELIPFKLLGGFVAYLMILLFPFFIEKLPNWTSRIYFNYVGLVFIITYFSRIAGQFEGALPSVFHYIGLVAIMSAMLIFPILKSKRKSI